MSEIENLDESVFNSSTLIHRTPPTELTPGSTAASAPVQQENQSRMLEKCRRCCAIDSHSKVKCRGCGKFQHWECMVALDLESAKRGAWNCPTCKEALLSKDLKTGAPAMNLRSTRTNYGSTTSIVTSQSEDDRRGATRKKLAKSGGTNPLAVAASIIKTGTRPASTTGAIATAGPPVIDYKNTLAAKQTSDTYQPNPADASMGLTILETGLAPKSNSTCQETIKSTRASSKRSQSSQQLLDQLKEDMELEQRKLELEARARQEEIEAEANARRAKFADEAARLELERTFRQKQREIIGSSRKSSFGGSVSSEAKNKSVSDWVDNTLKMVDNTHKRTDINAEDLQDAGRRAEEARLLKEQLDLAASEEERNRDSARVVKELDRQRRAVEIRINENVRRSKERAAQQALDKVRDDERRLQRTYEDNLRRSAAAEAAQKALYESRAEEAEFNRVRENRRNDCTPAGGDAGAGGNRRKDCTPAGGDAERRDAESENQRQQVFWGQLPWLTHTATEQAFLDSTLGGDTSNARNLNLTKCQIQARYVIPKEIPYFAGDPKQWPQFITAFANSTQQCGFTAEENMARLTKCLKGPAYEAVRSDLLLPSSLPSALTTLRMLYGRPQLILESAMDELRRAPAVRLEKFDTVVLLSLKVKSFCDVVRTAGMAEYLNHPTLLTELVQKLPPILQREWGRHRRLIEKETPIISIDAFNAWLKEEAETASCLSTQSVPTVSSTASKGKHLKSDIFHAVHEHAGRDEENLHQAKSTESRCSFCAEAEHVSAKCRKFVELPPVKRWTQVKKLNLCISCLESHWIRECPTRKECGIDGCQQPHHSLLHSSPRSLRKRRTKGKGAIRNQDARQPESEVSTVQSQPQPGTSGTQRRVNAHNMIQTKAYYQVVAVTLHGENGRTVDTYAFLDGGSTVTLLEESIASKLGLVGVQEELTLKWTNEITRIEEKSHRVDCHISSSGGRRYLLKNVRTAKELALPHQAISREDLRRYPHLKNVDLAVHGNVQPSILIGLDNHQLLTHQEVVEGAWMDPVAVSTRLGWTLLGGAQLAVSSHVRVNCHQEADQRLHDLVKSFFALESLGVKVLTHEVESLEDSRARRLLQESVRRLPGGRYEAGLLWRTDSTRFPDSRQMAMHRLLSFERKLMKNPVLAQAVEDQLSEYVQNKFLVKMTKKEAEVRTERTWYLPVFTVTNPNKPAKTRLVWDAAATVNGVSLNTELLTGPDLLANLVGVLLRFREHQYAVSADIKQMFHQIRIRGEDQDSQRCLWRNATTKVVETYRMAVMTFGAACSPSIAQYVKNHHAERYRKEYPRAVDAIHHRHYVDDYIDSFSSEQECIMVARQVTAIHKAGGFVLRNFVANSAVVLKNLTGVPECDEKTLGDQDPSTTVLGMRWLTQEDSLCFRVNEQRIGEDILRANVCPTKRQVLRILMMIFDPLGMLGFYILQGKLIMKEIWRSSIDWEELIKAPQMEKWREWVRSLKKIEDAKIPRCYFGDTPATTFELHTFVDASEHAAAAVVYLLGINDDDRRVAFVSSKTKIAPNKTISIPRMELQAAVIGARLANSVRSQHSLPIAKMSFWSDSRNVLCWLRSPRTFKPFVAHRVGEILDTTDSQDWRWVPTAENVADEATKWKISSTYCVPPRWFEGPTFLTGPTSEYPKERGHSSDPSDEEQEIRCLHIQIDATLTLTPEFARYSRLSTLLRVQAYVLRFFHRKSGDKHITSEELENARSYIIRSVQQEAYGEEWYLLKNGKPICKSSKLRKSSPFMDPMSILRMRSRLRNAEYLTYEQKYPILLPDKHHFTDLVIRQAHERHYHQFHGTVLNELQQQYRIPRLRSQLLRVRKECMRCRIRDARPEVPEMAALPRSRLAAEMRPFTYTGVDYFGPMTVKVGRRIEKRWGVIFTCLTIRAVHLELSTSLSADSFLMMLRSFVARRGMPIEVFCDNGTNFHGAETELRKALQANIARGVREQFSEILWKFNPPAAPHMGGAWERLIRSVKSALLCALPERNPTDELLRCCLVEVESVVNSRPLTYVEGENDSLEALTPNHFLLGTSSGVKPYQNFTDDVHILRAEWKRQQAVTQHFWTRWTSEYLPTISQRTKWYDPVTPLQVGDVVSVVQSSTPYSWQLGRIVGIVRSKDGGVRQAEVKTATGVLRRPASKLAVLIKEAEELSGRAGPSTGGSVASGGSPS